jgi:hypothetical protein
VLDWRGASHLAMTGLGWLNFLIFIETATTFVKLEAADARLGVGSPQQFVEFELVEDGLVLGPHLVLLALLLLALAVELGEILAEFSASRGGVEAIVFDALVPTIQAGACLEEREPVSGQSPTDVMDLSRDDFETPRKPSGQRRFR